ncbi:hypothetical protein ACFQ1S_22425 [Kibdelosporangium lantanae]|uniref:DUF4179 domain-containing protein n=1 Tax=Kibdelosporangium lantanae TaxID=1497396 RepID=A0ABW3MBV7_9PSEU
MSPVEEELKALLAPLRETQPTHLSTVDVVRAVRVGRRWQRGRIVAGVVAVVALIALPVIMIPTVLHSSPPADTPKPFPVSHRVFDVGTAGGYRPDHYTTSDTFQTITLASTNAGYDAGFVKVTRDHEPINQEATEPVNGHRAYLMSTTTKTTLVMEGPNDLWATIQLEGPNPDLAVRAHRVAESITFTDTPVTLPFTLTDPALKVHSYQVSPTNHTAMIILSGPGVPNAVIKVQPGSDLSVGTDFIPNRTIANQPAKATEGEIVLRTPGGYNVSVIGSWPGTTEAQLTALVTSVRLVGDPRDVSTWVRAPVQ